MAIEIEAKLRVNDFAEIRKMLKEAGAKGTAVVHQRDIYFDTAEGRMKSGDFALRLRSESSKKGSRQILTYKGPKQDGQFKNRKEIELGIDDEAAAIEVLGELGYHKSLVVEKQREIYEICGCEVGLDDVKELGTFVEIEGPSEAAIAKTKNLLGLGAVEHIKESYAFMIERLSERN